jgi:hypothetical protein
MALISCPECSEQVSDTSENCIKCGFVFPRKSNPVEITLNNSELKSQYTKGIIAMVASALVAILVLGSNPRDENVLALGLFFISVIGFVVSTAYSIWVKFKMWQRNG